MICAQLIVPKTPSQIKYVDALKKEKPYVVVAAGVAGTGKTLLSTHIGVQKLVSGHVNKLVITRPTVGVGGDNIGYLPGGLKEKLEPYMLPIYDALQYYYPKTKIEKMIKEDIIEIAPINFMRGRTFKNAWIICDEAQNLTKSHVLMLITRLGSNSKLVITGDPSQHDRVGQGENGLSDLLQRLSYSREENNFVEVIRFGIDDVERHPAIPFFLELYN